MKQFSLWKIHPCQLSSRATHSGIFSLKVFLPKNLGEIPLGAFLLASSQKWCLSFQFVSQNKQGEDVDLLPTANVLSILAFFKREILRLTKEWTTTPPQTPEERGSGSGPPNVGLFGFDRRYFTASAYHTRRNGAFADSLVLQFLKIDKNKIFSKNLNNIYKSKKDIKTEKL